MRKRFTNPVLPAMPTQARPGSADKIEVLRARVERGESLHHPEDERVAVHRIRHQKNPTLLTA
jgi:hypothetical protein